MYYAKFQFYSVAQIYAMSLDVPVTIVLGQDGLFWVVETESKSMYLQQGCLALDDKSNKQ